MVGKNYGYDYFIYPFDSVYRRDQFLRVSTRKNAQCQRTGSGAESSGFATYRFNERYAKRFVRAPSFTAAKNDRQALHYGRARRRDHHIRLYVYLQIPPLRSFAYGAYATFRRIERIFMGDFIPLRLRVFYRALTTIL